MSDFDPRQWMALQTRMARRQIGSGGTSRRAFVEGRNPGRNSIRSLTPGIVWFDGAIQDYMAPKLAKPLGDTGALVMTIARRSTRPHRRKRLAELTAYERDYYAPHVGKSVMVRGRVRHVKLTRADSKLFPMMPSQPGEAARYTPNGPIDAKHTILFGYDPATRSVVCGRILLAGRGSRQANVPQLLEEGGQSTISYGPHDGRSTYLTARPTMRLALAVALPRIEKLFENKGEATTITTGREVQITHR